eukprot:TRINITY_DN11501_c0_g2_i1.p2 TRINITY_DN11501_c0_g2~~TRINITY_DN11501_c0_g2_i1.p2  ORF type:complete len:176 (-),score=46.33 TRINITY_DN11501_c0_g2_i1:156-683(-)
MCIRDRYMGFANLIVTKMFFLTSKRILRPALLAKLSFKAFAEFTPINEHLKFMRESMEKAGMVRKPLPEQTFRTVSQDIFKRLSASCKELCEDYAKRATFAQGDRKNFLIRVKDKGAYYMWVDEKEQLLCVASPVSGEHQYWYEEQNEVWLSKEDLHNMLDRLARELIVIGPLNI